METYLRLCRNCKGK